MIRSRSGFALPMALVIVMISGLVITGVISYTSFSSRMTAMYTGKTRCRLAAESALELVRNRVYSEFQQYVASSALGSAKVYITPKSESAFRWFTEATTREKIGLGSNVVDFHEYDNITINGCHVRPRVARVQRLTSPYVGVIVTYMCTATYRHGSIEASATMCERSQYGVERSRVFDNAYFVNNYGWFQGTGLTANGDVRANGNMSLDTSSKINGNVYAAANPELGVAGTITNYGTMDKRSVYSNATYGTAKRSRPLSPVAGGYNAPASASTSDCKARLYPKVEKPVSMPWISDLNSYAEQGMEDGASLTQGGKTIIGKNTNGYYQGVGPSGEEWLYKNRSGTYVPVRTNPNNGKIETYDGDSNLTKVRPADYGCLVLQGTKQNPIVLNGPVVVSNDVIISGYVTGQGTIYSARNIHIVGDIQYLNPPQWGKRTQAGNNDTKDILGLAAQGNIVLGDCTDSTWLNNIKTVISTQPYVQKYACDDGDSRIGYPRKELGETQFCGDYTKTDCGEKMVKKTATVQTGTRQEKRTTTTGWGYNAKTTTTWVDVPVYETVTYYENSKTRRYYDSVVDSSLISSKAKGSNITLLDCILYNNHGLFGRVQNCTINGALVCRNEGIMYAQQWVLNWDYRLYSGSSETVDNSALGLPVGESVPYPLNCQEVPDSWNEDPAPAKKNS